MVQLGKRRRNHVVERADAGWKEAVGVRGKGRRVVDRADHAAWKET